MANHLATAYGEYPAAEGRSKAHGVRVELYESRNGGTWTLVMTLPNGVSCLLAAGENWRTKRGERL